MEPQHRFSPRLTQWGAVLIGSLLLHGGIVESAGARSWSEILADGELKIAVKETVVPLGFRDPEGNLVGFEIDLARELADRLLGSPQRAELIPVSNVERLSAVVTEQVDIAIAQVGITPNRARQVNFSSPYYFDGTAIAVAKANAITSWSDLGETPVAVLEFSDAISYLKAQLPEVELIPIPNYQIGTELLRADAVQGFAADITILSGWLADHPDYELLQPPLSKIGLGVVLPRGGSAGELNKQVNRAIQELETSGWLREKADQWGLP